MSRRHQAARAPAACAIIIRGLAICTHKYLENKVFYTIT